MGPTGTADNLRRSRWLLAGAIWGPGLFILAWALAGLLAADYSALESHISDLAAVDAPTRWLMSFGLAAFAIGVGISARPLRKVIGKGAALALMLNAGLTLGVLFTPLGASPNIDLLHGGFAVLAYLTLALVGPLAATVLRHRSPLFAVLSLAVGMVTLVCLVLSLGDFMPGLFQRIGLTTTDIWLIGIASWALSDERLITSRR